jgi:hypothetical protein
MRELVMKSELLKDYLEGDLAAEEELFARYDRELQVPATLWTQVSEQVEPVRGSSYGWWMGIAAVLVLSLGLGFMFLLFSQKEETLGVLKLPELEVPVIQRRPVTTPRGTQIKRQIEKPTKVVRDNPGVISTDLDFDIDEKETAKHIEQTENLLRTIRNYTVADGEEEIDVTYDKALSRRLLIDNVVLRRDAEMKAKFPTKTLLADLEPLLIDIANLPDHAKPDEVRAIKERVQKTEIVAALVDYRDK